VVANLFMMDFGGFLMSQPYIGQIIAFGGNFAIRGWALCSGQLIAISQNQSLFSILGTRYGGDGRSTFRLPDLRGRVPISSGRGPGLSNYNLGQKGGTETNSAVPPHSHPLAGATASISIKCNGAEATEETPVGNHMASASEAIYHDAAGTNQTMAANDAVISGNTGNNTGNAVNNIQPYQAINWEIALQGVYPSRN
jgi:microcystin-dependent protein